MVERLACLMENNQECKFDPTNVVWNVPDPEIYKCGSYSDDPVNFEECKIRACQESNIHPYDPCIVKLCVIIETFNADILELVDNGLNPQTQDYGHSYGDDYGFDYSEDAGCPSSSWSWSLDQAIPANRTHCANNGCTGSGLLDSKPIFVEIEENFGYYDEEAIEDNCKEFVQHSHGSTLDNLYNENAYNYSKGLQVIKKRIPRNSYINSVLIFMEVNVYSAITGVKITNKNLNISHDCNFSRRDNKYHILSCPEVFIDDSDHEIEVFYNADIYDFTEFPFTGHFSEFIILQARYILKFEE